MNDTRASIYLQRLGDGLPTMLAYWDRDLRCCYASRAYERWFGAAPDGLIGTSLRDLLGPALFSLNEPQVRGVLAGEPQVLERLVPGPGGTPRFSLAHYLPDFVQGQVVGFMVEATDITQRKQAEARLRASEALLDRTGRIAAVGGWEVDLPTGRVTWSDETCRIHGMPTGSSPTMAQALAFCEPEMQVELQNLMARAVQHGTPWDLEYPITTAPGRQLWLRARGEAQFEDGRAVRLIGALQDITEPVQRRTELAREHALRLQVERHADELAGLLRERAEMLDVLAHEVRQPLNNASVALQSATEALDRVGESRATSSVLSAHGVLKRVLASIDNTLAVATLLARQETVAPDDADIDTLLAVVIADMAPGERARVRVERHSPTRTAAMDASLMRLGLRNVLSNALRCSPGGTPVRVRVLDSDEPPALVFEVIDSGPGIPARRLPQLFEKGSHWRTPERQSSHGLGLYIVRRVMDLHGGRVEVVQTGPKGTTLRLVVPQVRADA